ncbi:tubby-related protein 4 [Tetranychus urticae]|uniref:SOCS box domain-containing protein n=1 Tax=Tetranychus urticae TaxID=32264 RepID=T1KNE5_TETUR|nr:tubby-related protein 4 [Tetranychus urticae]
MHLHFEKIEKPHSYSDCNISSLSWMGKVPDGLLQSQDDDGWKLNRTNYYQDGWIALGNSRGIVGVTYTTCRCRKAPSSELPPRTNYNLRGHRSEVTLVKWNEPYQKLASCDSSGIIFVWIKYEGRWSVELINDRNTQVIDFAWSHDGRMALICYIDGFVLIGSVAGQRYWSSMLNLESCSTTCGIWTPDDQQVIFGTSNGSILVIDINGTIIAQLSIREHHSITSMAWSSEKFKMEDIDEGENNGNNNGNNKTNHNNNSNSSSSNSAAAATSSSPSPSSSNRNYILSICFDDGVLYLLKNYDDICPIIIRTNLNTIKMEWSNKGDTLAVGGHTIENTYTPYDGYNKDNNNNNKSSSSSQRDYGNPSIAGLMNPTKYINTIKLYSESGILKYRVNLEYTGHPISSLTWGHSDKRLFVGTGPVLNIAWVTKRVASLHLLCRLSIYKKLSNESAVESLPLPSTLQNLVSSLFGRTLRCYLPDNLNLTKFTVNPPASNTRLYCTLIRHDEDILGSSSSYVLYLEYLGGLVPILKGKRTSKIRPEFVIFHPQSKKCEETLLKIEAGGNYSDSGGGGRGRNKSGMQNTLYWHSSSTPGTSDSESEEHVTVRTRRKRRQHRNRRNHEGEADLNGLARPPANHVKPESTYTDAMPEDEKLTLITSNIWGTKFKILGLVPWLPSDLGSVAYRTSLLHLQPRQMTLKIKELGGQREGVTGGFIVEGSDRAVTSSEDEDEGSGGGGNYDDGYSIPIAPMTPKKTFRGSSQSNSTQQQFNISNYNYRSDSLDTDYVNLISNLSEDLLTLHVNGSSNGQQLVSMEMISAPASSTSMFYSSPFNSRALIKSANSNIQPTPTSNSISTQTSFQSLSDILNPLVQMSTVPMSSSSENKLQDLDQSHLNPTGKFSSDCNPGTSGAFSNFTSNDIMQSPVEHSNTTIRSPSNTGFKNSSSLLSPSSTAAAFPLPSNSIGLSSPRSLRYKCINSGKSCRESSSRKMSSRNGYVDNGVKNLPSTCDTNTPSNCYKLSLETGRYGLTNAPYSSSPTSSSPSSNWFSSSYLLQYTNLASSPSYPVAGTNSGVDSCLIEGRHIHSSSTNYDMKYIDDTEVDNGLNQDLSTNYCPSSSTSTFGRSPSLFYRNRSSIAQSQSNSSSTSTASNHGLLLHQQQSQNNQPNEYNFTQSNNNNANSNHYNREIIDFTNIRSDSGEPIASQRRYILSTCKRNSLEDESDDELTGKPSCMSLDEDCDGKGITLSSTFCKCTQEEDCKESNANSETSLDYRQAIISSPVHVRRKKVFLNFDSEELLNSLNDCNTLLTETYSRFNRDESRGNLTGNGGPRTGHRGSLPQAVVSNEDGRFSKSFRSELLNRSLPTSPMLGTKNRRKAQGKSIFYSPTMFRKVMKQKLNYLDCSSEDDASSDDEFRSQDFRNLGNFQKSCIKKKMKVKKRSSRIQPDELSNQRYTGGREFLLHNKAPLWNEVSQVYQLDFGGRVTQESAKNFQIEHQGKQVMQFGRIDDNAYTLDFQYPFSALQALAVALANVTQRLK